MIQRWRTRQLPNANVSIYESVSVRLQLVRSQTVFFAFDFLSALRQYVPFPQPGKNTVYDIF